MAVMRFTILGCGSSGGVPRIGGLWGECDPNDPKNRRSRCSLLVERIAEGGITRVLIDTSPDMREQLLRTGVDAIDAVLYTHSHSDHVNGLDDLRQLVFLSHKRVPVWADGASQHEIMSRFAYAFVQPEGSSYPPICDLHTIRGPVVIEGAGGAITFDPFEVDHGDIDALGFRIGDLAYLPDVLKIPEPVWESHLSGLECWIVDALRRKPHPTHAHLALTLEWIERARPALGVLTNMHIDIDHAKVEAETPDHVRAAYDGMVLEYQD
ncbi:MAG: MBL fold metallo-hydrolase [Rhodobacteraceae bacterium]|nr:MBL fold metallo-hydrolase [Paracoccaceae bacterium]